MNIRDFVDYIQYEKRFSAHTVAAYSADLQLFCDFLSHEYHIDSLHDIHARQVRGWVVHLMQDSQKASSVRRKISSLNSYFKFCIRKGILKVNPVARITVPKIPKRLPVFVPENSLTSLIDSSSQNPDYAECLDQTILLTLYHTGIRRSELMGIKLSDLNMTGMTLSVIGKGNKQRFIPFGRELSEQLKSFLVMRMELESNLDYLFLTPSGHKLYPNYVYRSVKNSLSKFTTQDKKSPHVMRHSFATHLANKGADLNAVKSLLGHSSLAATQIYTHNTIEQLKNVYQKAHPKSSK